MHDSYISDAASLSKGLTNSLSSNGLIRLPSFFFNHFKYVRSNALVNVPVSKTGGKFPLLIYLTGLDGFRQASMFQIEHLVSHGYIVFGIDQPYAAASVTFPSGRIVQGLTKSKMQPLIDQSIAPVSDPPILQGRLLPDGIIGYFGRDVTLAIDKLFEAGRNEMHLDRIDTTRIGVFGVSLGAMVAAEASRIDPRIQACLTMDAAMPLDVVNQGLRQPVMLITRPAEDMRVERSTSGGWTEHDIEQTLSTQLELYKKAPERAGYFVSIKGMYHINFTDAPRYSPVMSDLGLIGPIDSKKGFDVINGYTLAFFDYVLNKKPSPLLTGSAGYPGVAFTHR